MKIRTPIFERLAQWSSVFLFAAGCWAASRAFEPRLNCLSAPGLSVIASERGAWSTCLSKSRLNLDQELPATERSFQDMALSLQALDAVLGMARQPIQVRLVKDKPFAIEISPGQLVLGEDWLHQPQEVQKALVMTWVRTSWPNNFAFPFELDVVSRFLLLSQMPSLLGPSDLKTFALEPVRHAEFCQLGNSKPPTVSQVLSCSNDNYDLHKDLYGSSGVLASTLARFYFHADLNTKLRLTASMRSNVLWPAIGRPENKSALGLSLWTQGTVSEILQNLGVLTSEASSLALKRAFQAALFEVPTKWELTIDLNHTPMWKEILDQLKTRSQVMKNERTLVFTPLGAIALPGGQLVSWSSSEVQSQKHVLIACTWPEANKLAKVTSRHMFAQQSCSKLNQVFWN